MSALVDFFFGLSEEDVGLLDEIRTYNKLKPELKIIKEVFFK